MRAIRETRPSSTTSPRLVKLAALFHCFAARYKNTQQKALRLEGFFRAGARLFTRNCSDFYCAADSDFCNRISQSNFPFKRAFHSYEARRVHFLDLLCSLIVPQGFVVRGEERGEKNSVIMQMPRVSSLRGEKMLIHDAPDYSSSMHKLPHKVTGGGG
jgi:hypothetical protein